MTQDPIRRWIVRRPALLFAVCLAGGMAVGLQQAVPWPFWLAALATIAALGLWKRRVVCVFAAALPLGALLVSLALIRPAVDRADDALLTGRIASEPVVRENYVRVVLDRAAADGASLPCRVMLYLYGEPGALPEYGAEISIPANLYPPSDHANPYANSYVDDLWRNGVALCASASSVNLTATASPRPSVAGLSIGCRRRLQSVVDRIYSPNVAPLVSALTLGDRSMLPDELYDQFRATGLAHVLSISGLHISCLAVALDRLLRRARCPERATFALTMLFLLAYASIVGFPASICRAILMYGLSAAARLLGRPSDGLTGLSLALIVLLIARPLDIADLSLILSFSSVAGLLIFTRLLTPRRLYRLRHFARRPIIWLISLCAAGLAAQLGALPAVACVFGDLPVYSLLANLPALPLMTVALPVSMLSVVVGCVSPLAGRIVALPIEWAFRALTALIAQIAALPAASLETPVWPTMLILGYVAVCLLVSPFSAVRRKRKQALVCLLPLSIVVALLMPLSRPSDGLEVLFLDVGQADAAVVRAEDRYYLVDVGEDRTVADHLSRAGIRPSGVFLSHPHSDHVGGLADVLELCPPSVLYLPCQWRAVLADEGVPELLAAAEKAGWTLQFLQAGDSLRLSEHVTAEVHQPWPDMTDDANGISLVMSIRFGQGSVLFTGDLPTQYERALLPDCDVLKVAHHGAKSSTSRLFLKLTSPSAAIVSVGHNGYGHPAAETLDRLTEAGAAVYRTDLCGAITVRLTASGDAIVIPTHTEFESEAAS